VDDGEALALAVAAFAETLPALADASEPVSDAPGEAVAAPIDSHEAAELTSVEPPRQEEALAPVMEAAPVVDAEPANEVMVPSEVAAAPFDIPATEAVAAENDVVPPQPEQTAPEISDSAAILSEAFADVQFSHPDVANEASVSAVPPSESALPSEHAVRDEALSEQAPAAEELPSEAVLPAQEFSTEPVAGPEEDPAELFEPQPSAPPEPAGDAASPAVADASAPAAAAPSEPLPQVIPPPPMRAIPRPPLSDPLAAIRDLSDEERIALFS
jgi:hypothetical protein